MKDVHFLELAALIGDNVARKQLKEVMETVDPPTEVEVRAFLELPAGRPGPFTSAQRREGRARLLMLMVEQSLEQRLDWGKDNFWGEEEFERLDDWPGVSEDEVAADADAGWTIPSDGAWPADDVGSSPMMDWSKASYPPESLVLAGETDLASDDTKSDPGTGDIVGTRSLHTAEGSIVVSVHDLSVFIRRPEWVTTDRLQLGGSDYQLDSNTGIEGLERVVGFSPAELERLIQEQCQASDPLACDD